MSPIAALGTVGREGGAPSRGVACGVQEPFRSDVVGNACDEGAALSCGDPCRFDYVAALSSCEASCAVAAGEGADRQNSWYHTH